MKFELSWEKVHSLFDSGFAFPRHKLNRNDLDETIYWNLRPFAATFLLPSDAMHVLAMGLCLSVPLSVCLSQVGVLLKRLNVGSQKQHNMIAQAGTLVF